MSRETTRIDLPSPSVGSGRHVLLHRYGNADAHPKAYLQASIHADEVPAMMALHHLLQRLERADQNIQICGEIVVVPYANPIGLSQFVNGNHLGRFELSGDGNFNRNWPDLLDPVAKAVDGQLTGDAEANVRLIREAMLSAVELFKQESHFDTLRRVLAREAARADFVLDVHCDNDALMHLYSIPELWPDAADLAADLEVAVMITAEPSGGDPFEEVWSSLWPRLAQRFPDHPIPQAGFAVTVELRGEGDVSDTLGAKDGDALFRFLQRRGLIEGDAPPSPKSDMQISTWNAVDVVVTPGTGVLAYQVGLGERVQAGQVIAELIDPAAEDPTRARRPITCRGGGLVFTLRHTKYVSPGSVIAKIAGDEPLPHRVGNLMSD